MQGHGGGTRGSSVQAGKEWKQLLDEVPPFLACFVSDFCSCGGGIVPRKTLRALNNTG